MSKAPLDERFIRYAETGDEALRNELVLEHQGLALAFARRYARSGPDEDLEQIALEALIRAIERFEPDRGLRFSTYAARVIDGRLKQHFRDDGWDVRVPRSLKQLTVAVRSTTDELTASLGRAPSPAELAERLGVTVDQIALALDAANAHRADALDTDPSVDETWAVVDAGIVIPELLEQLPDQERTVVALRFYGELSQTQIAERVGVSQMQVSRLLRRALERLRTGIDEA
ncbi:MAG: sigma-70 family RNA polymerase sigma factor [Actinomycetota bacterium]